MTRCVLFFLLIHSLASSAQQPQSNPGTGFLHAKRPKYSLSYPDSWTLDTSKMFGSDLILRSPRSDSFDKFSENINVMVQNLKGQNYFLSRMGKESETQMENFVTDLEVLESRLDSTAAHQFYLFRYKSRQGKFFTTTEQRYYLKNEVGIAVTFTMQRGKEAEYSPAGQKIFDSIELF